MSLLNTIKMCVLDISEKAEKYVLNFPLFERFRKSGGVINHCPKCQSRKKGYKYPDFMKREQKTYMIDYSRINDIALEK